MTVAELLCEMLRYYAHEFNYHDDVISIRTGGVLSKESKQWTQRQFRENVLLCIEDPFEVSHNLGRIVHAKSLHRIRGEFMRAHRLLSDSAAIATIFEKNVSE